MRIIVRGAALVASLFCALQLQGQTILRLGPAVGFTSLNATTLTPIDTVFAVGPIDELVPTLAVNAIFTFPLSSELHLRLAPEYQMVRGSATNNFPVVFAVAGEPVDGLIEREFSLNFQYLSLTTGVSYDVADALSIGLFGGVRIPLSHDISVVDRIVSPPGVTFTSNGDSERQTNNVELDGGPLTLHGVLGADITLSLPISERVSLNPYARASSAVSSALSSASYVPFQISLGIDVALLLSPSRAKPVAEPIELSTPAPLTSYTRVNRQVRDTVEVFRQYNPEQQDTMYFSSTVQRIDTVFTELATIVTTDSTLVTRSIEEPPPFLSTVVKSRVEYGASDKDLVVYLACTTVADSAVNTSVRASVQQQEIFADSTRAREHTFSIPLGLLIADLGDRDSVHVVFIVQTTDTTGQVVSVEPQTIVFMRQGNKNLQQRPTR